MDHKFLSVGRNWISTPENKCSGVEQENVQGKESRVKISDLQKNHKLLPINYTALFWWVFLETPKYQGTAVPVRRKRLGHVS